VVGDIRDGLLETVRDVAESLGGTLAVLPASAAGAPIAPGTTLVVAAHVDAATGALLDTVSLAARAHEAGALLVVDASWSVGAVPVDAPGTGADIVLADGHRWLLGPEGVTAAWCSERVDVGRLGSLLDPLPRATLLGLARSVGWLLMYVGLPWAFERAERLTGKLRTALTGIEGVEVLAPGRGLATTIPFRVSGWSAEEAAAELGRRCFAVLDADERRGSLRPGVGAWLRDDELDRFVAAVSDLARHTPETLPRRPMLTILGDPGAGEP
jgi:selenocysteine lyase/cysteine desulfurase